VPVIDRAFCSVGVSCVSISGGVADMCAVGLMNGSVKVYLLSETRQILSLTGHALCVNDASWSSTGIELITCGDDGVLQLWYCDGILCPT
jgi:WD40 repeat protein